MTLGMVEDALRALFASLFEGTPDSVVLYSADGRALAANQAACELTGYGAGELTAVTYREHAHVPDLARIERAIATALADEVDHLETSVRHRDGSIVPVELCVFPAKRNGEIVGYFAQARDIVALKSAERWLNINQERFRSLFEFHPDGILELKTDGRVSRVNVAFESETGFLGEQLVGKPWIGLIAPDFRERAEASLHLCGRGEANESESQLLDRLGNRIDVSLKLVPASSTSQMHGAYAIAKNVTAQRDAERAIATFGARIRDLYMVAATRGESAADQIDATIALAMRMFEFDFGYVTSFEGDEIEIRNTVGSGWNVRAGQRYRAEASLTRHLVSHEMLEAEDIDHSQWRDDSARSNSPWHSYVGVQLRVGLRAWGGLAFAGRRPRAPLSQLDRDLMQMVGLFVSAALERMAHAERIEQLAFTDSLTGLPNRVLFDDRIHQTIATARRYNRGFAVMYLDVDHFKNINDELGHVAGDAVLRALGERLQKTLRESDTVARFGGDEFVILQPIVDGPEDASDMARKIIASLQEPIRVGETERDVHLSIGIALYPQDGKTVEELMELSDRALYAAKHAGRNRWSFADEDAVRRAIVSPRATAER